MKWTAVPPDLVPLDLSGLLVSTPLLEAVSLLGKLQHGPAIVFSPVARRIIFNHTAARSVESGGLLIGRAAIPGRLKKAVSNSVICVLDAVPSEQSIGTAVSLEMDPSIWTGALKKQPPGSMIVGWFHSHPNLGAFFSGTDRLTQRNFFNHEYSLGYVIDPVRNEHAYFIGPESNQVSAANVLEFLPLF